ncbi:MAG: Rieske 2Fe-2S domain-containing protein [Pseudomonadota bacterium]
MSVLYEPVQWNRAKIIYDVVLIAMVAVYILLFLNLAPQLSEGARATDGQIQRIRAFGTCAFLMLTVVLCIGPAARLDRRFLPVLYNRRHIGVITAAVAFTHAAFVLDWYYNFSPTDRYVALLSSNTSFGQVLGFPFEAFGIFALFVLIVLAVTSHDFWLKFLTPPVWKAMHMAIYFAYAAVIAHIALGYLQDGRNGAFLVVTLASVACVVGLHVAALYADWRDEGRQAVVSAPEVSTWIAIAPAGNFQDGRAKIVMLPNGEKVAVFRHGEKLSALTNACAHQNGPLGEGRIVDGCVTCPWHGFQYRPEDGCAPAPFTEKIATYRLKLTDGVIHLDPRANPPGTFVEPIVSPLPLDAQAVGSSAPASKAASSGPTTDGSATPGVTA